MSASRPARVIECTLLFVLLPLAFRYLPRYVPGLYIPPLPVLWLAMTYCMIILRRDPAFDRCLLWNAAPLRGSILSILGLLAVASALLYLLTRAFDPAMLWSLVRAHPPLWAAIMFLYPLLSVYPQAVIYRAFFFHRYRDLFPGESSQILISAAAFSLMHIVFHSRLAIALTFAGGLLFAWRYRSTRSLFVSSLEHALYGCWIFTVGLGAFFYRSALG